MVLDCDVLVVGGGIAGSTCASILDSSGYDVNLIEQCDKLSHSHSQKIDFAEDKSLSTVISKYSLPLHKKTNLSRWYSPENQLFEFKSSIHDIWCKRGDENAYEITILKKSNVTLELNTKLRKIQNGIAKTIQFPNKKKEYKAKHVIMATGNFLPSYSPDKIKKLDQLYYGHGFVIDRLNIKPDIPHVIFNKNIFDNSYLFMVHNSDENLSYLAYGSTSKKPLNINILKTNPVTRDALKQTKILKPIKGSIYLARPSTLVQDNILFVGDAANLMDPLFSYGITNAIHSAVYASESICKGGNVGEHYKKACKEMISEISMKYKLRILFDSFTNEEINSIISFLNTLSSNHDIDHLLDKKFKSILLISPYLITNSTMRKIMLKAIRCML